MLQKKVALLIIDPQNDFCDIPKNILDNNLPKLPVKGAYQDIKNISSLIKNFCFTDIFVTLDTHNVYDIAHPTWWRNKSGFHPEPFTLITHKDIINEIWIPCDEINIPHALEYTEKLEEDGKYSLIVWPEHCIKGTWGHDIALPLKEAIDSWNKEDKNRNISFVYKGENPLTEHYSALRAEFQIKEDSYTHLNTLLIEKLVKNDYLFIAGEALSHCVSSTVMDLLENIAPENYKKIFFIENCSSSVTGFESQGKEFLECIKNLGINLIKSHELISFKNN